jgi:hypothetical protein
MTENQILVLLCLFVAAMRMPRIRKRWSAPLLRGPEWFFSVAVKPDFPGGPGEAILRNYRWRLFIPWAVEIPIFLGIPIAGRNRYIMILIFVATLLTRLNYYAARKWAEEQARRFELAGANQPAATVALLLHLRTLAAYTNWRVEAAIALALGGSLAWLGYRYAAMRDWQAVRGPFSAIVIYIYLQAGLLLIKRAMVRARSLAPADNAGQYLGMARQPATALDGDLRLCTATPGVRPSAGESPIRRETVGGQPRGGGDGDGGSGSGRPRNRVRVAAEAAIPGSGAPDQAGQFPGAARYPESGMAGLLPAFFTRALTERPERIRAEFGQRTCQDGGPVRCRIRRSMDLSDAVTA